MRLIKLLRHWKFLLLWNLIIRSCLPHVVFEEFGTLAGSVSYMHITLHINLTHIQNLVKEYVRQAVDLQDITSNVIEQAKHLSNSSAVRETLEAKRNIAVGVIAAYIDAAEEIQLELNNLRGILPPTSQQYTPGRSIYRTSRSSPDTAQADPRLFELERKANDTMKMIRRARRGISISSSVAKKVGGSFISKGAQEILELLTQKGVNIPKNLMSKSSKVFKAAKILKGISPLGVGFSLIKGIFGTFMGLYNAFQMEKL